MKIVTVIMAGGNGKRLLPLTYFMPKPLVPVNGKRLIDFSISIAMNVSAECLVTACYKHEKLEKYLRLEYPYVICKKEPHFMGTGGSLKFQRCFIESLRPDFILVLMADHYRKLDLRAMIDYHIESRNDMTILCGNFHEGNNQIRIRNQKAIDYTPKEISLKNDHDEYFSCMGEYFFSWSVISEILHKEKRDFFDLGWDITRPMVQNGRQKIGFFVVEDWIDLGTWENLEKFSKNN